MKGESLYSYVDIFSIRSLEGAKPVDKFNSSHPPLIHFGPCQS